MTDKEEFKNALKVLVNYCNQYDSTVCHDYNAKDFTPPHECVFWHTCHFDCHIMCDRLRDELEDLEKEENKI